MREDPRPTPTSLHASSEDRRRVEQQDSARDAGRSLSAEEMGLIEMVPANEVAPTVSVVIACYNYERYVAQAIESLLNQIVPPTEIIVVDDGSTDQSRNVIGRYEGKIKMIFQENRGVSAAVNRGYQASTGEIVMFLDADDLLLPEAVGRVKAAWRKGVSKVQFNLQIIDSEGNSLHRLFCSFPPSYSSSDGPISDFKRKGTYVWSVASGNAYARSFLQQVMPTDPSAFHDGVLNSVAPIYGDILTIDAPLGQYRIHGLNMSRRDELGRPRRYPDFSKQIDHRTREVKIVREHCSSKGMPFPDGNILDNEIVFVNYRLAARKLRNDYVNQEADSSTGLWLRGLRLALLDPSAFSKRVGHLCWFTALYLVPHALARPLLLLRFSRADAVKLLRRSFFSLGHQVR